MLHIGFYLGQIAITETELHLKSWGQEMVEDLDRGLSYDQEGEKIADHAVQTFGKVER